MALLPRDGIAIGKASNQWLLDILGVGRFWAHSYITHTLFTDLRFEPGEYNFVQQRGRERVKEGAKAAFHGLHGRY